MPLYIVGITIIVKNVETIRPDINVTAIGVKNELPEIASGNNPIMVVILLNIIGRYLRLSDEIHESNIVSSSSIDLFMCSSKSIALFTTIPIKLANPSPAVKEKGCLNTKRPIIEPIIDSGIVNNMINAFLDDLN